MVPNDKPGITRKNGGMQLINRFYYLSIQNAGSLKSLELIGMVLNEDMADLTSEQEGTPAFSTFAGW